MTIVKITLFILFAIFCFVDAYHRGIEAHEQLLRLSPAEQSEVLKAWAEEDEKEFDHSEGASDFGP